ncbi:MAG: hypothetical protein J6K42_07260 [Clostridia bacterium]|nr:hypothetical protein [Clostridia bacterium]
MIKQMAWNTFKNTGNINTFMELIEVENIEKELSKEKLQKDVKVNEYGEFQNKRNNIIGK